MKKRANFGRYALAAYMTLGTVLSISIEAPKQLNLTKESSDSKETIYDFPHAIYYLEIGDLDKLDNTLTHIQDKGHLIHLLNFVSSNGLTLTHRALQYGQYNSALLLKAYHGNNNFLYPHYNMPDRWGNLPLHYALLFSHNQELIKLAIENTRHFEQVGFLGLTPLALAICTHNHEALKLMIAHGAKVDYAIYLGCSGENDASYIPKLANLYDHPYTLVTLTTALNDQAMTQLLLDAGAPVQSTNEWIIAQEYVPAKVQKYHKMIKVSPHSKTGDSLVLQALKYDNKPLMRLLVKHQASMVEPNHKTRENPFSFALSQETPLLAHTLLAELLYLPEDHATAFMVYTNGETPLHTATKKDLATLKLMVATLPSDKKERLLRMHDSDGRNILTTARLTKNQEMVDWLQTLNIPWQEFDENNPAKPPISTSEKIVRALTPHCLMPDANED